MMLLNNACGLLPNIPLFFAYSDSQLLTRERPFTNGCLAAFGDVVAAYIAVHLA